MTFTGLLLMEEVLPLQLTTDRFKIMIKKLLGVEDDVHKVLKENYLIHEHIRNCSSEGIVKLPFSGTCPVDSSIQCPFFSQLLTDNRQSKEKESA